VARSSRTTPGEATAQSASSAAATARGAAATRRPSASKNAAWNKTRLSGGLQAAGPPSESVPDLLFGPERAPLEPALRRS